MDTSNHTWNPGDRPALRITAAGLKALAYFDYVNANHIVSLGPTDTAHPADEQPLSEHDRLERELDRALQRLRELRESRASDEDYHAQYDAVQVIRARIYKLENPDPTPDPAPEDPEIDLEAGDYDGMGGTPWDAGFEDMDDDDDHYGAHSPEED